MKTPFKTKPMSEPESAEKIWRRISVGHVFTPRIVIADDLFITITETKFMKHFSKVRSSRSLVLLTALAVACACQGQPTNATGEATTQAPSPSGVELSWPRQFEDNGIKVSIFQPQIEKWEGSNFETRSAVAVTSAGSNAPIYGVFWMKARADVD